MKNLGALNYAAALTSAARRSKLPGEQIAGAECREPLDRRAAVEVFSLDIPFYRTADPCKFIVKGKTQLSMRAGECARFKLRKVTGPQLCLSAMVLYALLRS